MGSGPQARRGEERAQLGAGENRGFSPGKMANGTFRIVTIQPGMPVKTGGQKNP
jgi:hypothetical protein